MNRLLTTFFAVLTTTGAAYAGPQTAAVTACGAFPSGSGDVECSCTGTESGSVWGSGPYTADSNVCVAARHAGAVGAGGGTVSAFAVDGQASYTGTSQNGVTTSNWGSYGRSFDFVHVAAAACGAYPRGEASYSCGCAGTESGAVWGSGPYTQDSNLCVAARHAGVIGQNGGSISALAFGGLPSYAGSAANGVTTQGYGQYGASVIFNRN